MSGKKKRPRIKCWEDPENKTAEVLSDHVGLILPVVWREGRYPSSDMRKGIFVPYLLWSISGLRGLLEVDKRGGFFTQDDMTRAVTISIGDKQAPLQGQARKEAKTLENMTTLIAYSLRVMLAHMRLSMDSYMVSVIKYGRIEAAKPSSTRPIEFIEIFVMMEPEIDGSLGRANRPSRKRQCPFPAFRDEGQQPDDDAVDLEEEGDDAVSISSDDDAVVDYHQDGEHIYRLLADGRREQAHTYMAGDAGFVIADWGPDSEKFDSLVPNSYIQPGGSLQEARRLAMRNI